ERLVQSSTMFAKEVLDADLADLSSHDLQDVVQHEVHAVTPLAMVSVLGYDASYRVESLVAKTGRRCVSVAMGSQEGFSLADQAITSAARQGDWVLLKNVHLASSWL